MIIIAHHLDLTPVSNELALSAGTSLVSGTSGGESTLVSYMTC